MEISDICLDIKKKKELSDLKDSFVINLVKNYISENNIDLDKKNIKRTSEYKLMFKEIRRILRKSYGSFKDYYDPRSREVYKKIFSLTLKPKSILDLGCGLTPLDLKNYEYHAYDISSSNIEKIKEHFKKKEIKGTAALFDLIYDDYSSLPSTDICFLFKVLESLEAIKKNISLSVLNKIKSKYIVISFAKNVLSGNVIIKKKGRQWFRRILKYNFPDFKEFDTEEEIFYIITK
jgi:2-polyprenyl-3-methyl-5-hydroxy-6-metoxy-1,4-benzoquinol methylase